MHQARLLPARRALHLLGDAILIGWIVLWGLAAWGLKSAVDMLAVPSEAIGDTTRDLARRVDDVGSRISELPLVGEDLQGPFGQMGVTLRDLAVQSEAQAASIHGAAWLLAVFAFAMPVLTLALIYLPPRIRRARESAAARAYIDELADLDLFALRAMARAPMTRLAQISPDPVRAWRSGDPRVIQELANLELKRTGIGLVQVEGPTPPRTTQWGTREFH